MASYKTVLDVSKYQTVTSWSNIAKNVDGVIIRCGYRGYGSSGTLTKDPKFSTFIKGASEAGIPLSVYFFSQAITEAEAKAEADYTISLIDGYTMSMPIYIDIEYANSSKTGRADSLSKSTRTAVAAAFCKEIEAKGYEAGVYSSDSWFNTMLDQSKLKSYSLWVARYSSNAPQYVSSYDGWQYTSSGTVSGVSGKVDLSKWYGTIGSSTTENASSGSSSSNTSTAAAAASTTSSSSSSSTTSSSSSSYTAGTKVTLKKASLYASATSKTATTTKTGAFYLWDGTVTNGRIRITNTKANVGKSGQVTGWISTSSISGSTTTTTSSSSSSSSSSKYTAGTKVTLKKVNLYASATSKTASGTKTGTFYLWDGTVTNSRIRITNSKSNVGKSNQVTGWISTSVL